MEDNSFSDSQKKNIHLIVPPYMHKEIRIAAAQEGVSIMQFCLRAILDQLQNVKQYKERV